MKFPGFIGALVMKNPPSVTIRVRPMKMTKATNRVRPADQGARPVLHSHHHMNPVPPSRVKTAAR